MCLAGGSLALPPVSLLIVGKGWSSYPPPCPAWHTLPRAEMAFLPTSSLCRPFYTHFPVPFPPKDWGGQQQSSPGSSQGRPCDWVSANEAGAGICWEGLPFPKTGPPRARPLSHLHCGSQAAPPLPGSRALINKAVWVSFTVCEPSKERTVAARK